jgi:predicted HAD superfamily Cof-like phosphohydrolase
MNHKKYEEPQALNDTATFHRTFDLPILDAPIIPSKERCQLRLNLLQEELDELKEAIEQNDLLEVADAFCDIQYVLSGAIHEFGLTDRFKAMFDAVQKSNMSKVCATREVAERTVAAYAQKGEVGHIVPLDGAFLVYRTEDGKVLKSVDYQPVDLKPFLDTE